LVGLGAPHWAPEARGVIAGLALGTTRAHLARAAIEAIAFQVADVFAAMEADLGQPLAGLSADGGAARNDFLMQFQADIIGRPVLRGDLAEVSAAGAAMLARGPGTPIQPNGAARTFSPTLSDTKRRALFGGWRDAVARALLQPDKQTTTD
jgi:glycerol kinase